MKRVMIIGMNGAGKTTLSRELAQRLNLPLIHVDRLHWRDGWQRAADGEFDRLHEAELSKPEWIIEGNIARTIPVRLRYCDTVIFMDFSRRACVWGVVRRVFENYGRSRPDMGGFCPERLGLRTLKFIANVWRSHSSNRARFYRMLNDAQGVNIVVLKNRKQARSFLDGLPDAALSHRQAP